MSIINSKIVELLNFRIKEEEQSNRLYLSMSKWLVFNGYDGAGALWGKYAAEETTHAGWAYTYLEDLDILPCIPTLEEPKKDFTSLRQICELSYEHEVKVTEQCKELAKAALDEGDYMVFTLSQQYLKEQVEELARQLYWINKFVAFGESDTVLQELDKQMEEKANG